MSTLEHPTPTFAYTTQHTQHTQQAMSAPIQLINKALYQSVDNIFAYKTLNKDDVFYQDLANLDSLPGKHFQELDIRSGAGNIPLGYLNNSNGNSSSSIIAPSYSLPYFVNSLKNNNNNNTKLHFNVPALNYINDKLVNDYSIALSIAKLLDYTVITPINSGEVVHTTLLSLAINKYGNAGVFNLFDSINYVQSIVPTDNNNIVVPTFNELDLFLSKTLQVGESSLDSILTKFNQFMGTHLHNFHYQSASNASASNDEIVFVTYGSIESELFNNSTNWLPNNNYGVLNVRIPLPFDQDQFITHLPSATKKIIVINNNNHGNSNVFDSFIQQINATLFYHGKSNQITVSQFTYDTEFIWSQAAVNKIIASFLNIDLPSSNVNHAKNFIYYGNDSNKDLYNDLSIALPSTSLIRTKFDNLTNGGIIQKQFFFNTKSIIGDNIDLNQAQLVFIQDPSIIARFNITATLASGAIVVVAQDFNNDTDLNHIDTFIKDFKFNDVFINGIRDKGIHLVLIKGIDEDIEILQGLIKQLHSSPQSVGDLNHEDIVYIKNVPEILIDQHMDEEEETQLEEAATPAPLPIFPIESAFKPSTVKSITPETTTSLETTTDLAKKLSFKEAYGVTHSLRPDLPVENFIIKVKSNKRVTPVDYDRYIFNIEFDIRGTNLKYDIGEALGIHARNNEDRVLQFINEFNLDPCEIVLVPSKDNHKILESRTLFQSLVENLDLFGKPPKRFYESLIPFVADKEQREKLNELISPEGAIELKRYQEVEFYDYVDIFKLYSSAKWTATDLVSLIAPLKRREYSIASSQRMHPNEIHLLIVVVDWVDKQGRKRFGQASKYIADLKPGQELVVSVKPSVMKLPPRSEQPVIMSGLGTGLAPFKAIVEEKIWQLQQGMKIGKIFLYLGSRHRREEYLYGELWEAYKDAGIITHIGAAFSRDQPQKIYIQDRIRENLDELKKAFIDEEGSFYLCGPTWPVPDITNALQEILAADAREKNVKIDLNAAIEELKESSRYILEVY